jgi:hypothetical protein
MLARRLSRFPGVTPPRNCEVKVGLVEAWGSLPWDGLVTLPGAYAGDVILDTERRGKQRTETFGWLALKIRERGRSVIQSFGWMFVLRLGDAKEEGWSDHPAGWLVLGVCASSWCVGGLMSQSKRFRLWRGAWVLVRMVGDSLEGQLAPRHEDGRPNSYM